ncbi:MAG: STM3941 family protein [Planctomycetota bacterium]
MPDAIHIPLSRTKVSLMLLGAAAFVVVGLWMLVAAEPVMVRVVGGVATVFFGLVLVVGLRRLLGVRTGLVIDDEGIIDRSSGVACGRIPWRDIASIQVRQMQGHRFVTLIVEEPERYAAMGGPVTRLFARANLKFYDSPIHIPANTLRCDFDELVETLASRWQAARARDEAPAARPPTS